MNQPSISDHEQRDRELFDRIAEGYCRKDLQAASRLARKLRTCSTLRAVPVSADKDVLDVGCGAGFAARYLEGEYASYCGVDYSESLIKYAIAHNTGPEVGFAQANIKEFDPGRTYDLILAVGVLHHLDDLASTLCHLVSLLSPGGWLVANEPQSGNPLISIARRVRKKVDPQYSDDQVEMSGAQLRAAYDAVGLKRVQVVPQGLFSTPFAEVPMRPQCVVVPLAAVACLADRFFEAVFRPVLPRITWNLIVAGQRPTVNE